MSKREIRRMVRTFRAKFFFLRRILCSLDVDMEEDGTVLEESSRGKLLLFPIPRGRYLLLITCLCRMEENPEMRIAVRFTPVRYNRLVGNHRSPYLEIYYTYKKGWYARLDAVQNGEESEELIDMVWTGTHVFGSWRLDDLLTVDFALSERALPRVLDQLVRHASFAGEQIYQVH